MILEDDTKFRAPVPALRFREFIHLGEPVLRRPGRKHGLYKLPLEFREVYYPFRSSYGAWAYGISPEGPTNLDTKVQLRLYLGSKTFAGNLLDNDTVVGSQDC